MTLRRNQIEAPLPSMRARAVFVSGRGEESNVLRLLNWAFIASIPLDVIEVEHKLSPTFLIGVVLLALWIVVAIRRRRLPALTSPELLLAGFVAVSAITTYWSIDPDATLGRVRTLAQLMFFCLIARGTLRNERDVTFSFVGYLFGCVVVGISTIYSFAYDLNLDVDGRVAVLGFDPNDLGVTVALGIPMACFIVGGNNSKAAKLGAWAYVPFALFTIALTASRGATLAAAASLPSLLFAVGSLRRRYQFATCVALLLVVLNLLPILPESSMLRLGTIASELQGGSFSGRTDIWRTGMQQLSESWTHGIGAGAFPTMTANRMGIAKVAHNTPLSVLTETGVVGGTLFFGAFALAIFALRRHSSFIKVVAGSLVLVWLVGAWSLTWEHRKASWLVIVVLAALARVAVLERKSRQIGLRRA